MTSSSFSSLPLPPEQLTNLDQLGYHTMTPIQAAALPPALEGLDVIGQAQTGSGKTAVFALALLHRLVPDSREIQALVCCPTRELSLQVTAEIRRLARFRQNIKILTVFGGQPISLQKQSLKHGAHVVVGTPGRLKDLLGKGALKLASVTTVVLDEADRMLEMGFIEDITAIVEATPSTRQTLLFSATFPDNIRDLSATFQRDPRHVQAEGHADRPDILQTFHKTSPYHKLDGLAAIAASHRPVSALIFANTKQTVRDAGEKLVAAGFHALTLHGDLEQRQRIETLIQFKNQSCTLLVATDVAARGLDILGLPLVINLDLPNDPDIYLHRIGRTGRAGQSGHAVSLCVPTDQPKLTRIAERLGTSLSVEPLPPLSRSHPTPPPPAYRTLCIAGGRKDKLRPGELLGALTGDANVAGADVGQIEVMDYAAYVAIKRDAFSSAYHNLKKGRIKGRRFQITQL